jgi:3-hydroxybutyryl-CoA dehydrogenase
VFIARIFVENKAMKIVVLADDMHWEIFKNSTTMYCTRATNVDELFAQKDADAYFNLLENSFTATYVDIGKPIFINSVCHTLTTLNAPNNVIRINGWASFFEKDIWEIAGEINPRALEIIETMGKKCIVVPDIAGFISARIIAMIINEAYFAKDDNVSSEEEIDIAMKLGTNYPFGPFEWSRKIGLNNVYDLLATLAVHDERYTPAQNVKPIKS